MQQEHRLRSSELGPCSSEHVCARQFPFGVWEILDEKKNLVFHGMYGTVPHGLNKKTAYARIICGKSWGCDDSMWKEDRPKVFVLQL